MLGGWLMTRMDEWGGVGRVVVMVVMTLVVLLSFEVNNLRKKGATS